MSDTTVYLKRLREEHKLSQSEISRLTGIPQPVLSRWEAGEIPRAANAALKLSALAAKKDAEAKRKKAAAA